MGIVKKKTPKTKQNLLVKPDETKAWGEWTKTQVQGLSPGGVVNTRFTPDLVLLWMKEVELWLWLILFEVTHLKDYFQ